MEQSPSNTNTTWHQNAKFGIIIHWGVYSVPGYDSPAHAKRRNIMNGSEWYLKRLTSTFRVGPSERLTKEYHTTNYPNCSYQDLAGRFTATNWNPNEWAALIARSGARYAIITAKHHDGFCLWKTDTNHDWNSADVGPKRDIVSEFRSAIMRLDSTKLHQGIVRFGLYYSWHEWNRNTGVDVCGKEYVSNIVTRQIQELAKYKPNIVFFDGDWLRMCKHWHAKQAMELLSSAVPDIAINDRLGKKESYLSVSRNDNSPLCTYRTFADRTTPTSPPINTHTKQPWHWERVDTIGLSWGRNRQQTDKDYKSVEELVTLLIDVVCKGGCLLLNLGPNSDGTLDIIEVERLEGFGKWLEKNGEAIYDTVPGTEPLTTNKNGKIFRFVRKNVPGGWEYVCI